eukprot:402966-Pyramimonas_sp.AAC.1
MRHLRFSVTRVSSRCPSSTQPNVSPPPAISSCSCVLSPTAPSASQPAPSARCTGASELPNTS